MPVQLAEKVSLNDGSQRQSRTCTFPRNVQVVVILNIVNFCNAVLVFAKIYVAYISGCYSIATSAIESFADIFVGALLLIQWIMSKRYNRKTHPRGRKTEANTNLLAASVMITLATVTFIRSLEALITGKLDPDIDPTHIAVAVFNVLLKIVLFLICFIRRDVEQIVVLMRDQLTDVATNTLVAVAAAITLYWNKQIDFVGALLIYLIIVYNWGRLIKETWGKLQGTTGSKRENNSVSKVLNENTDLFEKLGGFLTYHVGAQVVVEVYGNLTTNSTESRKELVEKLCAVECVSYAYLLPFDDASGEVLNLCTGGGVTIRIEDEDGNETIIPKAEPL